METISLLDLKAEYRRIGAEVRDAIARVLEHQQFILGTEVEALEREVAAYCGSKFAIGVSSGTDAILVALMALGIGKGDEVITTAYSFFATAGTIARTGATPVFVDIDPVTFNIDPVQIESRITSKTRVILPVHLFGQMADMQSIARLAAKHRLVVVEDAAQAIGAELGGARIGSLACAATLSFFPTKNLGGYGDAGMVLTNDAKFAARIRSLRVHGSEIRYRHDLVGGNFRLDALQAAVLRVKLRYLSEWTEARRCNAALYRTLLPPQVRLPVEVPGSRHVYHQFVVRHPQRDKLRAHLTQHGIGSEVYYPIPLHLQKCFEGMGQRAGDYPQSERAALESLAIPVHPELTPESVRRVASAIETFR